MCFPFHVSTCRGVVFLIAPSSPPKRPSTQASLRNAALSMTPGRGLGLAGVPSPPHLSLIHCSSLAFIMPATLRKQVWLRGLSPGLLATNFALSCLWAFAGAILWIMNSLPVLLIEIPGYHMACSLSKPFLIPSLWTKLPLLGSRSTHCPYYAHGIYNSPTILQQIFTELLLHPSFCSASLPLQVSVLWGNTDGAYGGTMQGACAGMAAGRGDLERLN